MEIIFAALVNGFFAVLVLVVGKRLKGEIQTVSEDVNAVTKKVEETHEQVKNTHKTNLREDIDGIRNDVQELRTENISKFQHTNRLIQGVQETQSRRGRDIIEIRDSLTKHLEDSDRREEDLRRDIENHFVSKKDLGA